MSRCLKYDRIRVYAIQAIQKEDGRGGPRNSSGGGGGLGRNSSRGGGVGSRSAGMFIY